MAFIEIHWMTDSVEEARKICRFLLEEGVVACAQISQSVESMYVWKGKIEEDQERKILLKARLEQYEKIKEIIEKHANYEVPQITYYHIDGGNPSYLNWLEKSLPCG